MKVKRMAQFRYFGENHPDNYPEHMLEIGDGFETVPTNTMLAKYSPILRLIITTIPGVTLKLHINDTATSTDNNGNTAMGTVLEYVIGATGILDLNFENLHFGFRGLEVEPTSIATIEANPENYFIITIIYEVDIEEEE